MTQNNFPGGAAPAGAPRQKKERINQVELTGYVEARTRDGQIKFFSFTNGGGALHINIKTTEPIEGQVDANGYPRTKTTYIPVSVMTNKNISDLQLKSIAVGMKVHVVGRLVNQKFEDKKTGQQRNILEVQAYVFEILAMPMQAAPPQYGPQPPYPGQTPYPTPQFPGQMPGYPPQAQPYGPQYPGQPSYPSPQFPGQAPGYPPQAQPQHYAPQPQYPGQPTMASPIAGAAYNDPNDLPAGDINV